jgi:hypothetical protein
MAATKKPSAAERTVNLFDQQEPEPQPATVAHEPKEDDPNRFRDQALKLDEWQTKNFGSPFMEGTEFRLSHRGGRFYLERLESSGGKLIASYAGLMLYGDELEKAARVLVQAVKDLRAREGKP